MARWADWSIALAAGVVLAVMIQINSQMATYAGPVLASWIAHGLGTIVAVLLIAVSAGISRPSVPATGPAPAWAYLGGIPGALTVVLAALAVNSSLGLSGTLVLMLVGQIIFGLLSDRFGLLGIPKRALARRDAVAALLVFAGGALLLFGKA